MVFLCMGILLAPTALKGQVHASDEEIALKASGTVKPPLPRSIPVYLCPVQAWLNFTNGEILLAFAEDLGSLDVYIANASGQCCASYYSVDGNDIDAVLALPNLASGTYRIHIVKPNGEPYLYGDFVIP